MRPWRERLEKMIAAHAFSLLDPDELHAPPCVCGEPRRFQCDGCARVFCVPCPHACIAGLEGTGVAMTCGEAAQLRAIGSPAIPRGPQPRLEVLVDAIAAWWSRLWGAS